MNKTLILVILAVGLLIVAGGYASAVGGHQGHASDKTNVAPAKVFNTPQAAGVKATCPVTGESFAIAKDTLHLEYRGKHVYFCCPGCKPQFDKDPEKYLK